MGSTMMDEDQHHSQENLELTDEPGGQLQLAIATTFSVAQTGEFLIKQEPQEILPEMLALDMEDQRLEDGDLFGDVAMDEEMPQVYPIVSDDVLQRAVSPPTYIDPSEQKIQELILYYKKIYQLKDITVELESCDKIWETLQLIKNVQSSNEENDPHPFVSPNNLSKNQSKAKSQSVIYQSRMGYNNKALPDFRFSVKGKKKLYHCITCGKEFINSQLLRQHAIEEHGIYVNPKRVYTPRTEVSNKNSSMSDMNTNKFENIKTEEITQASQINHLIKPVPTTQLVSKPINEKTDNSLNSNLQTEEPQVKSNNAKEKIKCVLCKRVCTDIVYHMKGYHKVGCINPIIEQCEKVIVDNNQLPEAEKLIENNIDLNESLAVAVKKRKRNAPRWTIQKKKRFCSSQNKINTNRNGPFKCNICLGIYKSIKSYNLHKQLHRKRGDTADNFDPSKCRFKNSPYRLLNAIEPQQETVTNYDPSQKEIKSQNIITNYFTIQKDDLNSELQNEIETVSGNADMKLNNENLMEQTNCECGRSFRNYYTMHLHKVKCKGFGSKGIDVDSSLGISIKIKKNKNDSYEVVPTNALADVPTNVLPEVEPKNVLAEVVPTNVLADESTFKESRSSKDSDSSSNDSGVVSVDYNSQKGDSNELSKYSKGHSVLRIQVAEDDEEVDIEDGDSVHSNLVEENDTNCADNQINNNVKIVSSKTINTNLAEQNSTTPAKSSNRKINTVPTLTNLCRQVLSKSKKDKKVATFKCQMCSMDFESKTELIEHSSRMNHNTKSICPCGKKFKNLKFFNIHVRRYHPLLLKCNYCMTNFDRIENYNVHNCTVIEGQTFIEPIIQTPCLQCKTLVDLGDPFDKHIKTHEPSGVNYFQCFKCELKFDNSHQRRSHFSKEHGFSLCRVCGKLLHIDYLLKHEAYHDGLGHPCHLCKKAFTQKVLLKKHVQNTHDSLVNESVKCFVCSKNIRLRHLKKHMSCHLHTEICRKCNKCYRSDEQKNLEEHVALDHPDDYPALECDTCNVSFLSDKRYQEHCQQGCTKLVKTEISAPVESATLDT